ncbi:UNVERIFIED_CONTAM: hypothetical protein Slati_3155000 [Sesamum latifolium]|uniref:Retrotransposon gag domain-containing protein n=1 Tax=Sesamum latifolium TaxID=2727402 RepID=A0AAW2UYV4_9LAMI
MERMANVQAFPLAMAPPRRSSFATHILAEAIQPEIKIPNISEYDETKDPQDHLDQFLAKSDLLDISDGAYCKIFGTTLTGKAMTWFNQLPSGMIDNFVQLSQRFFAPLRHQQKVPQNGLILIHCDPTRARESLRLRAEILRGRPGGPSCQSGACSKYYAAEPVNGKVS